MMFSDSSYKNRLIIFVNCFLIATSLLYTQTIIICLPSLGDCLSGSYSVPQLMFVINIFFFGLSQLFYGPYSNQYGRKKTLVFGLVMTTIGSLLSGFSLSNYMLVIGQVLAGFGAGSCSVIPRLISKDLFSKNALLKIISYMSMSTTIANGIAPILGSSLQLISNWRMVFFFLAILSLSSIIICLRFLPETCVSKKNLNLKKMMSNYRSLFFDRWFLIYSGLNACAFSSIIIYLLFTPFIFQNVLRYSANQNALIFSFFAFSYFLGNFFLNLISDKIASEKIILIGALNLLIAYLIIVFCEFGDTISVTGLTLSGLLIHFGSGLLTPITYKEILISSKTDASLSTPAINFIRVLISLFLSIFFIVIPLHKNLILVFLMSFLALGCVKLVLCILRKPINELINENAGHI